MLTIYKAQQIYVTKAENNQMMNNQTSNVDNNNDYNDYNISYTGAQDALSPCYM